MLGKEDAGGSGSRVPCQLSGGRKAFWRSASWSSSRSALPPLNPDDDKDAVDPNGDNCGQSRKYSAPLTPRSQHNFKSRSSLPPLAIARRSLDEWPKAGQDDVGEWPLPITPGGRDLNKNGDRLKLDLSMIQRNKDKNGGLVKREKIAFFDKECSKVAEHIYLGGDAVARDRDILKHNGITHILNCVGFVCPEYFKADFVYRTLWLQDSPSEDITSILYDVFDYFEDVREQGGRVFVHCCQGVSRSTSLVIAYLMWREGQSFDDAFQYVKAARGIADPNMGFACQLLQCQKRVHAFPLSPSSLLRMYRVAPHSPYDPLHLVPKMLIDPSPSALDSRGAFIIHIPSSIYVWIGKKCEAIMERDARAAVCQIVRYERLQGPIVMIDEGEEPPYFWNTFSNLLPLMDKSSRRVDAVESSSKICPGERKVDSYNVDFEVFQKAIVGGFVPPFASCEAEHETHLPARESSWSVLRRKFASGNMKEFVLASKSTLSRVYPDSMLIVSTDNSVTKPLHTASSSTSSSLSSPPSTLSTSSSLSLPSSPPYLSPDSISSDLSVSSKCLSDSPAVSPPETSCSQASSSTLRKFSNLSLSSSKIYPQSICKSPEFIDVNFVRRPTSEPVSSSSKKIPLSIMERRGNLSKFLKLPMLADDSRENNATSNYLSDQQDSGGLKENTCSSHEARNTECFLVPEGSGDSCQEWRLLGYSGRMANVDLCHDKAAFVKLSDEPLRNHPLGGMESTIFTGVVASGPSCCSKMQPVVFSWPSLERVMKFGEGHLDSKAAFIVISPSLDVGKTEDRNIYFWVGRSFSRDESKCRSGSNRELGDVEEIDWNQVSHDVLTRMGLPEDSSIKIVKEDEEPAEFFELFTSL